MKRLVSPNRPTVLSLCDLTANMVKPWSSSGYPCLCVDLQHPIRRPTIKGLVTLQWADVRSFWPEDLEKVGIVFAFPPCTHLAVSGARDWTVKGLTPLIDSLTLVESCRRICEASGKPWMIENPVGRLSHLWRKPDYIFNPCDYAGYLPSTEQRSEAYTKRTCLWVGGGACYTGT